MNIDVKSDRNNSSNETVEQNNGSNSLSDRREPKTGDSVRIELYATAAMIAGLSYILLYFAERSRGMSENAKDVFVAAFIRWAKKGGVFRRMCALLAIFVLLVYYHSIGKRAEVMQRELYGA